MNNLQVSNALISRSPEAIPSTSDARVHGGRNSEADHVELHRIKQAVECVIHNPEMKPIFYGRRDLDKSSLQATVQKALQAYSRTHGVLKLVENLRNKVGSHKNSNFLLDLTPLAMVICRVHGALEQGDDSPEVSGAKALESHELGRIVLSRSINNERDELSRKTHSLGIQCELAPNVYESPVSAIVLGIAQDIFLYPKIAEMINLKTTRSSAERFSVKVLSGLGVPKADEVMERALQNTEMRVFEQVIKAVYSHCVELGVPAEPCLSVPVADLMFHKSKRLRYDAPLGLALKKHLAHQATGLMGNFDLAELLDLFQAQVRDCRAVTAPPAAIGRAYFNSQFRNLLCAELGIKAPEEIAAFEAQVRTYREWRTEGVRDAPTDAKLFSKIWSVAPEKAHDAVAPIIRRGSSSETMVFEMEDLI